MPVARLGITLGEGCGLAFLRRISYRQSRK